MCNIKPILGQHPLFCRACSYHSATCRTDSIMRLPRIFKKSIFLLNFQGFLILLPFQLSNTLFEELAVDVYDEVDRRENETSM